MGDEMKGESRGYLGLVIGLPAIVLCLAILGMVKMIVEPSVKANATATILEASRTRTVEDHALDTAEQIAEVGFASNVAIAASGDASQSSIVKSFASVFIAIAFCVASVAVAYFMINKKEPEQNEEEQEEPQWTWQ
jgi:hypothetical protein